MTNAQTFLEAVEAGDAARVDEFLAADPALATSKDATGVGALFTALYRGHSEIAAAIRQRLEDLDVHAAAALGDGAALDARLDEDQAAVHARSADGFTPLHLACFFGHADAARRLLESGADVEAVAENPSRVRPLHSALPGAHGDVVTVLLEAEADVDAQQMGGWTPLMAAAKRGSRPIVAKLLGAGADRWLEAEDGSTAMDLAAPEVRPMLD